MPCFAREKKAQNQDECFSSAVEAKTESVEKVAFEKALLKKFLCKRSVRPDE